MGLGTGIVNGSVPVNRSAWSHSVSVPVAVMQVPLPHLETCGCSYLREATLRAVRSPGTVTLARDLNSSES
jgi:hypothetical protein